MTTPGFTAEASLYRTSVLFHAGANFNRANGGVHPAQSTVNDREFTVIGRAGCHANIVRRCFGFVDPSGYYHEFCFWDYSTVCY